MKSQCRFTVKHILLPMYYLSMRNNDNKPSKIRSKFSPGSLELVTAPLNDLLPASPRWAWPWSGSGQRAVSEGNPAGPRDFGRQRPVGPRRWHSEKKHPTTARTKQIQSKTNESHFEIALKNYFKQ